MSAISARAAELRQRKPVKDALKKDRAAEDREEQLVAELFELERGLAEQSTRATSFGQLHDRLGRLSRKANAADDSSERRMSRRVLRGMLAGGLERVKDPEYRKLLEQLRATNRPWG